MISRICPVKPAETKALSTVTTTSNASTTVTPQKRDLPTRRTSPLPEQHYQQASYIPRADPIRPSSTPAQHALPPILTNLFPRLTEALLPKAQMQEISQPLSSLELAELGEEEFTRLLENVLEEEGFSKLVERVQRSLQGKVGGVRE